MKGWDKRELGTVVNLKRGHDLPSHKRELGKIPIFSSSGISGYHSEIKCFAPGVVTGRYGTIGQVFYSHKDYWPLNTTLYVEDFKGNIPRFIYYFLQQLDWEQFNDKSAVPGINRNDVHKEIVFFPLNTEEQKAIAAVLSSLDDKIDLLHRQNTTLEAMAEALFKQWFVVEAKEEWEDIFVGDVAHVNTTTRNKNYPFDIIQYLDTGSLTDGLISELQICNLSKAPSRAQRIVKHNDILISTVRPNQRHYGIIKNPAENLIVSTGFCVLNCHSIDPHFLYLFLTTKDMTEYLHSVAEGSTSAYPSLKPSDIEKLELKRPPKDKLQLFSAYCKSAWDKISENQTQIRTLEKLRDTLLPKLMSGEVRVEC